MRFLGGLFLALSLSAGCGGDGGGTDTGASRTDAPRRDGGGGGGGDDAPVAEIDAPSSDPYEAAREACVGEINRLRATNGLPPLARWRGVEDCMDNQANADQMANRPHGAWSSGAFPECNGSGQNECLGHGPDGVVSCMQQMWDERLQAGCSGCDACRDAYNPSCPNCDFYGSMTGDVCGHYVNMNAAYFTEVACGFSDEGGWVTVNFR